MDPSFLRVISEVVKSGISLVFLAYSELIFTRIQCMSSQDWYLPGQITVPRTLGTAVGDFLPAFMTCIRMLFSCQIPERNMIFVGPACREARYSTEQRVLL
jgi:hypothetical protein